MWTTESRHRYDRDRLRYPSDSICLLVAVVVAGSLSRPIAAHELPSGLAG
jgi:hypothetical protein